MFAADSLASPRSTITARSPTMMLLSTVTCALPTIVIAFWPETMRLFLMTIRHAL